MIRFAVLAAFLAAALFCPPDLVAQISPTDLPPSPFSLPASTEPQSASYLRNAGRALGLHASTTNAAVKKILGEIQDLKQRLAGLTTNAWQADPMLLTCDQYIEKAHDWAVEKHGDELNTGMTYFLSTNDQATVKSRQKLENDFRRITELILFHELDHNTNFAWLQKSLYEIVEQFSRQATNANSSQDICRYWWFDRYIGFPDTNRPTGDCSFTNLQTQINRRYELLVAGLVKMQREKNIPPAALAGLKYGHVYRTLDGMCEVYLEVRTPPEVRKLREELSRKLVALSWADK